MNKILISILFFVLIGCCDENNSSTTNLEGDVKKITEYLITINDISNGKRDTLYITDKFYNRENQIVELQQEILFDNENMNISYHYNGCGKLIKEEVKMSFQENEFNVFYTYRNSLLHTTTAETIADSLHFFQLGLFKYNENGKLTKSKSSEIFLDLITGDTIKKMLQTDFFNKDELIYKSEINYRENPNKNSIFKYYYKENELVKTEKFNNNDSLISEIYFQYEKDTLNNWVSKKIFEGDSLKSITTREIFYR